MGRSDGDGRGPAQLDLLHNVDLAALQRQVNEIRQQPAESSSQQRQAPTLDTLAEFAEQIMLFTRAADTETASWVPVSEVAWGVYGSVEGINAAREPVTATGYIVYDHPLRGGPGGFGADRTAVYLGDRPDTDSSTATVVFTDPAATVIVLNPPPHMPAGTPAPYTRMPIEDQLIVAGNHVGLPVTVIPADPNPLYQVADDPPTAISRAAEYLLDGGYAHSLGRAEAIPHPNRTRRPS